MSQNDDPGIIRKVFPSSLQWYLYCWNLLTLIFFVTYLPGLRFIVGQKQSPSRLVILKSRPMLPSYFCHVSFMKFIEIVSIKIFWKWFSWKVIHFGLKKMSLRSITNKNVDIGKVTQSGTVQWEMLTEVTFNQTHFYFSFLWHKILVLIFNMFIYTKVHHSKFVETKCTERLQIFIDPHPSQIDILYSPQG